MIDPSRHLLEQAVNQARNGHATAAPAVPPLELVLHNSHIAVADVPPQTEGPLAGADKALIVTHATGGLRIILPMNTAAAREVGNLLAGRPNIEIPK